MSKTALRFQHKKPKEHLRKKYRVKISLSYSGVVEVDADSKRDAVNIVYSELGQPDTIKFDTHGYRVSNTQYSSEVELKIEPQKKHIR